MCLNWCALHPSVQAQDARWDHLVEPGLWSRWYRHPGCGGEEADEGEGYESSWFGPRKLHPGGLEVEERVSGWNTYTEIWAGINTVIKRGITLFLFLLRKGDRIYHQLKKLGSSLDWDRACFTMDPVSFLKRKKLIYINCTSISSFSHLFLFYLVPRNFPMQCRRPSSACMRRGWFTEARGWSTGPAHWTLPSLT